MLSPAPPASAAVDDEGTFARAEVCPPAAGALADVFPCLELVYPAGTLAETPYFEPGLPVAVLLEVDAFG